MTTDELFMQRCFDLAQLGAGSVAPNPMVGAVLVHEGRIIGEGWHRQYGGPHAEVYAVRSVAEADQQFIQRSTLYCSLEPCFHFGKTPPCVDLVLQQKIPRVVVSNTDPNPLVAGQSLAKLRAAGVDVVGGVLETQGHYLNRTFFTWIAEKRPFIVLKWAQSADGCIGRPGQRTTISGPFAQRLVHRWRAESDAILVGTTTALVDNPRLDNRFYFGKSPLRVALDFKGKIPGHSSLLDDSVPTWILGPTRAGQFVQTEFLDISAINWIPVLLERLYHSKRSMLLVEGGSRVLQQFIDLGLWDEIRQIESPLRLGAGIRAPEIPAGAVLRASWILGADAIREFGRSATGV